MRRISWTDQRIIEGGALLSWLLASFLGAARYWRDDGSPPSWRTPASRARHGDASHARNGSRCGRARVRSSPSRSCPRSPSDVLPPGPGFRCLSRPDARSRRKRDLHPRCCGGSTDRASTSLYACHHIQRRRGLQRRRGRPVRNRPSHAASDPWLLGQPTGAASVNDQDLARSPRPFRRPAVCRPRTQSGDWRRPRAHSLCRRGAISMSPTP